MRSRSRAPSTSSTGCSRAAACSRSAWARGRSLAERGRRVIGLDVSRAMLDRLRAKEGAGKVAVAIADATPAAGRRRRVPRCVLPMGPAPDRVLAGRGRRALPGGRARRRDRGRARRVLGRVARGLAAVRRGARPGRRTGRSRPSRRIPRSRRGVRRRRRDQAGGDRDTDAARQLARAVLRRGSARAYSWTWRASDADLARAVATVRVWAVDRFGPDLTQPFSPDAPQSWRVYDLRN